MLNLKNEIGQALLKLNQITFALIRTNVQNVNVCFLKSNISNNLYLNGKICLQVSRLRFFPPNITMKERGRFLLVWVYIRLLNLPQKGFQAKFTIFSISARYKTYNSILKILQICTYEYIIKN